MKTLIPWINFFSELQPIISKLQKENSFSIVAGDYNQNLLKVGDVTAYSQFFEFMTGKDFIPMITLPTRFDKKSCSLIDNIWVNKPPKGALEPSRTSSRVFLKKIAKADHLPCLLTLDIIENKQHPPKYVYAQKIDELSISKFRIELIRADIRNQIDQSPSSDPEQTYEKIRKIIQTAYKNNFPVTKKCFQRHKHNIQPWMTKEIMKKIKSKDECI